MSALIPFQFEEKRPVRVVLVNADPWFVLTDVLKAMGSTSTVTAATASIDEGLGKGFVNNIPLKTAGGKQKSYIVNEPAVTFLVARSRTEDGKRFNRWIHAEVIPAIRKTGRYDIADAPQWHKARSEGKQTRKIETDAIASFVAYAIAQGSKNAHNYYINITKGTYKALFILEKGGNWRGLRNHLAALQLNQLSVAEWVAQKYIAEGMSLHMHYKDIYRYAIAKVEEMAALLGKQLPGEVKNIQRII